VLTGRGAEATIELPGGTEAKGVVEGAEEGGVEGLELLQLSSSFPEGRLFIVLFVVLRFLLSDEEAESVSLSLILGLGSNFISSGSDSLVISVIGLLMLWFSSMLLLSLLLL